MIGTISHLTILVNDQSEALKFYTEKLGFRVHTDAQFGEERWLTVAPNGIENFEIALVLAKNEQADAVGKQAPGMPLASFFTDDCEKTYGEMKKAGVKFLSEPKKEQWGTGACFSDLYGNNFYLNQPNN